MTTPRDKFFEENQHRLKGLTGKDRDAMIEQIVSEATPFIEAEVAEHEATLKQRVEHMNTQFKRITIEQAARQFVRGIALKGSDELLIPHVVSRMDTQTRGDDLEVIVKDAAGKPSSFDELADELRNDAAFAPIVQGASDADKLAHARKVAAVLGQPVPK